MKSTKKVLIVAAGVLAIGSLALGWKPVTSALFGPRSVGFVSWSSATVQTRSSRTIDVSADVNGMGDKIGCSPTTKATVRETTTTVTIAVQVLNNPLPPNTACGSPGFLSLPTTIHLKRPIGHRVLLDGTTRTQHGLLIAAEIAEVQAVPPGFAKQSAGWDEATGEVAEWWRHFHPSAQFNLNFGPNLQFSHWEKQPSDALRTTVAGHSAVAWRSVLGADTVQFVVEWKMADGDAAHLSFIDQSPQPTTLNHVLAIARSIR